MAIKKKQGDSLWVDISGNDFNVVDEVWANWTGSWAIVAALGEEPVLSGTMAKTDTIGQFRVRIGASYMQTVPVGSYILVCEVKNDTVDYCQEIAQEKLTITTQGIAP